MGQREHGRFLLIATGNNEEESGAHGASDVYVVAADGTLTRMGDHSYLNYAGKVAWAPRSSYGEAQAAW